MRIRSPVALLFLLLAPVTIASTASAQSSGSDYLFRRPAASIEVRGGIASPSLGSQLFSFVQEVLTLDRGDFRGFTGGAGVNASVGDRTTVGLDFTYHRRSTGSEYRDWVEDDGSPIVQTSSLIRAPILAKARVYLLPRGRTVGSFAWIPESYAPYLGAGAGLMWHRFTQSGDFVDIADSTIYTTMMETEGWTTAVQALAGLDYSLSTRLVLNSELSYTRSNADTSAAFEGPIDLSGLAATVGLAVRF